MSAEKERLTIDNSWVIVDSYGQKYLGRVVQDETVQGRGFVPVLRAKAERLFARPWPLFPCYDYGVIRSPNAAGEAALALFVTPDSLLSRGVPVWVAITSVRYIEDMHETDLAEVRNLVRSAEGYRTVLRTKRAGLTT
jgi:hypothetical protein